MLDALRSVLKHPVTVGAGAGALGGGGIGYFSAEPGDPNRWRKALAGAGVGAGLGGLTGSLISSGASHELADEMTRAAKQGPSVIAPGGSTVEEVLNTDKVRELITKGHTQGLTDAASKPELMKGLFDAMSPDHRDTMLAAVGAVPMAKVKSTLAQDPSMLFDVLEGMDPSHRETLLKKFDKGWLSRMFGG